MIAQTNSLPESLLSLNGASLLLKSRGLKPNTRHSLLALIARGGLTVAGQSQWGVLVRRADIEHYAEELAKVVR
jgi:hypothetical protein